MASDYRAGEHHERFESACRGGDVADVEEICKSHPYIVRQGLERCEYEFRGFGTGLHLAASRGRVECCRVLLDAGADIEVKDGYGRTPLMNGHYCYGRDCGVLELLLRRGANARAVDKWGWTTLHLCVHFFWNTRAVKLLVSAGADIHAVNHQGDTPLVVAGDVGNLRAALELIKLGAKEGVNKKSKVSGETLLHVTAHRYFDGSVASVIETLVAAGADLESIDHQHRTPLITAASQNNTFAGRKLLELGANFNACDKSGTTSFCSTSDDKLASAIWAWRIEGGAAVSNVWRQSIAEIFMAAAECGCERALCKLAAAGANPEERDKDQNTALLLAAKNGHTRAVFSLVKVGARADARNKDGQGAYHLALGNGHLATAAELIKIGVDANVRDLSGNTALHLAAKNGHTETVCEVVRRGADVNACNDGGDSPLHLAVGQNRTKTVRELIKLGAAVDAQNWQGNTALLLAAMKGHVETLNVLVYAGANIEACNGNGDTALLLALKHDRVQTATALLQAKDHVQAENKDGDSALIFAARHDRAQLVNKLLKAGARVSACNKDGRSALLVACLHGRKAIARTLIAAGADLQESNRAGNTPLLLALKSGFADLARVLIEAGANVHTMK